MGDAPPPYPGTTGGDFTKVPLGDAPTTNHQQSYGIGTNNNRFEFTVSTGAPQPLNAPPPIVVRAVHARTALFGPYPVEMDCPYCRKHIVTHTDTVAGALPWIIMGVCFVLGFFLLIPWCLCCLPFCIDSCLDVNHSCPSCKRLVGRFVRFDSEKM